MTCDDDAAAVANLLKNGGCTVGVASYLLNLTIRRVHAAVVGHPEVFSVAERNGPPGTWWIDLRQRPKAEDETAKGATDDA